jgi:TolB-like protein
VLAGGRAHRQYESTQAGEPVDASMATPDRGANAYVLGHSDRELERLRLQAQLIDPITRQFLIEAGIAPRTSVIVGRAEIGAWSRV